MSAGPGLLQATTRLGNRVLPPCLPQFVHINRYYDSMHQCFAAKILPGEYYISTRGEMITTVLGSCVAVCAYDPEIQMGGMNHFMLPGQAGNEPGKCHKQRFNERLRYGRSAIDALLGDLLRLGCKQQNLVIKVFGGAQVFGEKGVVGRLNAEYCRSYFLEKGIAIVAEDTGSQFPRKIKFSPLTGKVMVKRLQSLNNDTIERRERNYHRGGQDLLSGSN